MAELVISAEFEDLPLLESTAAEYRLALESGEMSERESIENITALAQGMLHLRERRQDQPVENAEESARQ
jgi:hypothetical protein